MGRFGPKITIHILVFVLMKHLSLIFNLHSSKQSYFTLIVGLVIEIKWGAPTPSCHQP